MEIVAFLVTVVVGLFATSLFDGWLNWPQGGPVFAVAVMGAFILWAIRHKDKSDES